MEGASASWVSSSRLGRREARGASQPLGGPTGGSSLARLACGKAWASCKAASSRFRRPALT
eukprot:9466679-Pyramimonas_sp.AAC.1